MCHMYCALSMFICVCSFIAQRFHANIHMWRRRKHTQCELCKIWWYDVNCKELMCLRGTMFFYPVDEDDVNCKEYYCHPCHLHLCILGQADVLSVSFAMDLFSARSRVFKQELLACKICSFLDLAPIPSWPLSDFVTNIAE